LNEDEIFECLVMMSDDKPRNDNGMERFISEYFFSTSKKNTRIDELKKLLST
jgi:hypothetical protein